MKIVREDKHCSEGLPLWPQHLILFIGRGPGIVGGECEWLEVSWHESIKFSLYLNYDYIFNAVEAGG